MDTSTFALTHFISIRETFNLIRSDCGTNFIDAKRQVQDIDVETLSKELEQQKIKWILHPPPTSHFGGCWERKIGSVRRVLEAYIGLMGNRGLSYDEFSTFLKEASQIVNNTEWLTGSCITPWLAVFVRHFQAFAAVCDEFTWKQISSCLKY